MASRGTEVGVEEARRIAIRAQALDGSASDVLADRATARLPPARSDRHRRDAAGARAVEQARRLRPHRARPAALGGARAVRVERLHLADRVAADGPRHDAPPADVDALRARTLDARVHDREPVVPALRHARARAARPAALPRARRPRQGRAARPPLVRLPARRPHADDPAPLGRDRGRRKARAAAALGSRRARLPGRRCHDARPRPGMPSTSSASARRACGSRRGGCSRTRTPPTAPSPTARCCSPPSTA